MNKIERDELKEQAHRVQRGYYSATVNWKDKMFCGTDQQLVKNF